MVSLVSQDEALRQMRMVEAGATADQLADLNAKAEMASAIVCDYLKRPFIEGDVQINPLRRRRAARDAATDADDDGLDLDPPSAWPATPLEPWTPGTVPVLVKAAILIVLTALYDGRTPGDVLLSPAVNDILIRLRDPAIA